MLIRLSELLLSAKGLACTRDRRVLFHDLNLTLTEGQCLEVQGPNGSGKSTLLRVLAGLFPDFDGEVEAPAALYLGHKPAINALLTPLENLEWYGRLSGQRADIEDALGRVGFDPRLVNPCSQLSQGQQRRVSLARLLICQRPLWLLDEPFTALDVDGQRLIRDIVIEHCAGGGAVVCATHQALGWPDADTLQLG